MELLNVEIFTNFTGFMYSLSPNCFTDEELNKLENILLGALAKPDEPIDSSVFLFIYFRLSTIMPNLPEVYAKVETADGPCEYLSLAKEYGKVAYAASCLFRISMHTA